MTLLDQLQQALSEVGNVRVAARFRHDKLRFPEPNDLRIFVPDMHLIHSAARKHFHFSGEHSNHTLLTKTLKRIVTLRKAVKNADPAAVCATYFMGDFLDLWRAGSPQTSAAETAEQIALEHADLLQLACGVELKARFLLGNHDFELCRVPSFVAADRRFFFPSPSPSALALHGDVFDWAEDFPDLFNEVVVYYFSPFANLLDHTFEKVKNLILASNQKPGRIAPNGMQPVPADALETTVVSSAAAAQARHELFKRAFQCRTEANFRFSLDLRTFVIGHTHEPRIVAYESGADFFTLVDTGGWLEDAGDSVDGGQRGMVTGFCANEIRIFELSQ